MGSAQKKPKQLLIIPTGGTISMNRDTEGVLSVGQKATDSIARCLQSIPGIGYTQVDPGFCSDSSDISWTQLNQLCNVALTHRPFYHGVLIRHGTDTMNRSVAAMALAGNEIITTPIVFVGSIHDQNHPRTDAFENSVSGAVFAAYSNHAGVFAIRPRGVVITSRHDTPGMSVNWHTRKYDKQALACFARVNLDSIVDKGVVEEGVHGFLGSDGFRFRISQARLNEARKEGMFTHFKDADTDSIYISRDNTLDTADQNAAAPRGLLPSVQILGFRRGEYLQQDSHPHNIYSHIKRAVDMGIGHRNLAGRVIPELAILENVKRRWPPTCKTTLESVFPILFHDQTQSEKLSRALSEFWLSYSGKQNGTMDATGIQCLDVLGDGAQLFDIIDTERTRPRGIILRATGAAGMRISDPAESYTRALSRCRELVIPVVVTSASGEVTSLSYGPPHDIWKNDLAFFAGTMDTDLVQPRMALLNTQREFMHELISTISEPGRLMVERNMYRQLLSGTHYAAVRDGVSDRSKMQTMYGTETRVDLLGSFHVRKAIVAAYLHEVIRNNIPIKEQQLLPVLRGTV
jgi:L-asparaginase/Glu-tRNA(Gln) amidotransferase subunit D